MILTAFGSSDIGKWRSRNEDSYFLNTENGVFAVADGMGGHAAGEIASRTAIDALAATLEFADAQLVRSAFMAANRAVWERSAAEIDKAGMGTTLSALAFDGNRNRCLVGHVGDSRVYRLRGNALEQLTLDHTVTANILYRAIGTQPTVDVDVFESDVQSGDRFLLCSDGLTGMVSDEDLRAILLQEKTLELIVQELIETANLHGGVDNITGVLIAAE